MDEHIRQEKQRLRQTLRALTETFTEDYLAKSDRAMETIIRSLAVWERAKTVFIYVSIGREPDTRGLLQAALALGKTLAIPCTYPGGVMEARVVTVLDGLRISSFGIPEPGDDTPVVRPKDLDLVVVPCIAADQQGYRLGYGGGYYDRYLARVNCPTVSLCRERLLQDTLPHNALDVPVDQVVTEKRLIGKHLG